VLDLRGSKGGGRGGGLPQQYVVRNMFYVRLRSSYQNIKNRPSCLFYYLSCNDGQMDGVNFVYIIYSRIPGIGQRPASSVHACLSLCSPVRTSFRILSCTFRPTTRVSTCTVLHPKLSVWLCALKSNKLRTRFLDVCQVVVFRFWGIFR